MSKMLNLSLLIQVLLIGSFLVFNWQAEQAMDKSGIGNVEEWSHLNHLAGISINCLAICWISTFILILSGRCIQSKQAKLTIALPPLILIVCWVGLFLI